MLVETSAASKVHCPMTYGDIEYQFKKACVDGMTSHIDRTKIANIIEQVKMMHDQ